MISNNVNDDRSKAELRGRIFEAKREKNAVILVHNYQPLAIQELADYLGYSLFLARAAMETEADLIVMCGVDFMAETVKVLNPGKKVVVPDREAVCPMSAMVNHETLEARLKGNGGLRAVAYVNTSAAVKALSYACCTSANAAEVVKALPEGRYVFVPDRNLGRYAASVAGRELEFWPGYCHVHDDLLISDLERARSRFPGALFIAHPECRPEVLALADKVASTAGMVKFVSGMTPEQWERGVIIGTEIGLVEQLQNRYPGGKIVPLSDSAICPAMKLTTLAKLAFSLENEAYEISLPYDVQRKAKEALDRMFELTG